MSDAIKPFRISVADDVLNDLRSRLRHTRWPEAELVEDWSQGVPLDWIREICRYWAEEYDWRAREVRLNRFPQFVTEIDGLGVHFLHVRSPHPDAPDVAHLMHVVTTARAWSRSSRAGVEAKPGNRKNGAVEPPSAASSAAMPRSISSSAWASLIRFKILCDQV